MLSIFTGHRSSVAKSGWPAFINVDKVEHGQRGPDRQACFLQPKTQPLRVRVAPAALGQIGIPDLDFLLGGLVSTSKSPFERLVVGSSFQDFFLQCLVIDPEEAAAQSVEGVGTPFELHPRRRELSLGKEPYFVEHPTEMDDAADAFIRAA